MRRCPRVSEFAATTMVVRSRLINALAAAAAAAASASTVVSSSASPALSTCHGGVVPTSKHPRHLRSSACECACDDASSRLRRHRAFATRTSSCTYVCAGGGCTNNILDLRGGSVGSGRRYSAISRQSLNNNSDNSNDDDDDNDDDQEYNEGDWRRDLQPSPYDYTPPSALDRFGASPQIRNAAQAASGRYGGTIVLAAVAFDQDEEGGDASASVVCCSLRRVRKGVRQPRAGSVGGVAVHIVSCADSVPGASSLSSSSSSAGEEDLLSANSSNPIVAVAASGLRPDLNLLLSLLRTRSVEVWDRYDVAPGPGDMAESISQAFLTFFGYDRSREAGDGAVPVGGDQSRGDDDGAFRMSRPFGLECLVLGVGWDGSDALSAHVTDECIGGASLLSVAPSGIIRGPFVARAVGSGADYANELLKKKWRSGLDEIEVKQMCKEIIKEVAKEKMGLEVDNVEEDAGDEGLQGENDTAVGFAAGEGWEIVCETLSSRAGLVSTREPFSSSSLSIAATN